MMSEEFWRYFRQACGESAGAAAMRLGSSPVYQEIDVKVQELYAELEERLGERRLLMRLNEALNQQSGMDEDAIYQQAFRDCFSLLKWMDAFDLGENHFSQSLHCAARECRLY